MLSPEERYDYYHRLAGEVEARTAQERAGLTPEARAKWYPPDDWDVPRHRQILWDADGSADYHQAAREQEASEVSLSCALKGVPKAAKAAA